MDFSRLYLLLRLPLAILICSQLVFLDSDFPPDDYLTSSDEVADAFDERDDNKFFDVGLPVVIFKDALIQQSNWVSLDPGYVSGTTLELRATGPPNV